MAAPDRAQRYARRRQRPRGSFYPTQVSAVSAWLRLANGTIAGEGYSSVPDVLQNNPAVQATDARRPVNGTSANGLPIATFTADFWQWPLVAANNGDVRWGVAGWFQVANTTGNKQIATITSTAGGASANKINPFVTGSALRVDDQTTDRHAQGGTVVAATWHFLTYEVDCAGASEAAQVLISVDGVLQSVAFSSDTAWAANIGTPTGNMLIGAASTAAGSPFVGSMGPNLYSLNRHLTATERANLLAFERPT